MKKINKNIFVFVLSVMLPLNWLHATSENKKNLLHSASEYDYPPYCIVTKDGKADGFSVELLRYVAEKMNMDIDFKVGPWAEIKKELIDGRLDVLPLVGYSKEREKYLDFSAPYLVLYGGIFVRSENTDIKSEADLKDKEVIVMEGDSAHEYVLGKRTTDKVFTTKTYIEAFKELSEGKHDAIVVQKLVGITIIKELSLKNIKSLGGSEIAKDEIYMPLGREIKGFEQNFCFAVPRNQAGEELIQKLNQGLVIAFNDKTFDRLFEKWFPSERHIDLKDAIKYLFEILFAISIIASTLVAFFLKKQVKKKTKELSNSEEKYRNLSETLTEVVYVYDYKTLETTYINKSIEHISGYSVKNLIDDPFLWVKIIYPEDKNRMLAVISDAKSNSQGGIVAYRIIRKDGTIRWVEDRFTFGKDNHGNIISQNGIVYDITERKESESNLKERMRQLEILGKISVERELKMRELKEKNVKLEQELEKKE